MHIVHENRVVLFGLLLPSFIIFSILIGSRQRRSCLRMQSTHTHTPLFRLSLSLFRYLEENFLTHTHVTQVLRDRSYLVNYERKETNFDPPPLRVLPSCHFLSLSSPLTILINSTSVSSRKTEKREENRE